MDASMPVNYRLILVIFLLLLPSLTGCIATSARYQGNLVDEDRVVEFKLGGPHTEVLQTFDITVNYEYLLDGDTLNFNGHAVLGDHYQAMYTRLNSLYVYLFLVDTQSRVIQTSMLVNALMTQPNEEFEFNVALKRPPGVAGISIGYDGEVYEPDDAPFWSTTTRFYRLPLKRH